MAQNFTAASAFGLAFFGYRHATCYTVASTRHIRHVTVAISIYPVNPELSSIVNNEYLEWELREGTADTAAGLTGSSLKASGKWRIIDHDLWPPSSIQYKTATFGEAIEHDSTKYYFLVIKSEDESGNGAYFPVWWGHTAGARKSFYHAPVAGWTEFAAAAYYRLWIYVPDDQAGVKYHAIIDGKGFMTPDNLGSYNTQLATQFGGSLRGGQSRHSQLSYPYSSFSQDTFRHGMGWTYFEDPQTFFFGYNADVRVEGQVILAPRMTPAPLSGILEYHMTDARIDVGLPWIKHGTEGKPVLLIAQRVHVISASHAVKSVWLSIRKEWMESYFSNTLTFTLRSDNAGVPGTIQRTIAVAGLTALKWHDMTLVELDFADYGTPPIDEELWLVLECEDIGTNEGPVWSVSLDPTHSYGEKFMYYYNGAWVDDTANFEMHFFLNMGAFPTGGCFFAEFLDCLYVAAGPSIYKWNEASKIWEVKVDGSGYGGDVTGFVVFGGNIWAAWGTHNVVRYSADGTTWSNAAYSAARLHVAQGFLWRQKPAAADQNKCNYSNNGVDWSADISIGESDTAITGFCLFNDVVVVSKEDGLWYIDRDHLAHSYFNYEDQKYSKNGENLKVWSNNVYIPILSGLWRWTGSSVDTLGPDRRAGMPRNWDGYIRDIISCANWMFVAVDAGDTGWSQVLCYNGIGWLPFIKARTFGEPIRKIFITSAIGSELRLWVMEGKHCYYCALPYTRENHFEWSSAKFESDGTIVTSWWNGGLFNARKYFKNITLEIDGLIDDANDRTWVDVWYQVDGEENLLYNLKYLGRISSGTPQTMSFGTELVAYSVRFIFKLGSTNATYTPRLKSYNVDCIVRPDPSYVTSLAVSLSDNLVLMDKSECSYTAEELWEHLKLAQSKSEPIIISLPWGTIYGFISALQTRTRQYKEAGATPLWEQVAVLSIVQS